MLNDSGSDRGLSILLVDDDEQQRVLLEMLLAKEDYQLFQAEDGEKALEIFETNPSIRLIITDLDMPKKNGFELISSVRQHQIRYAYIIVLTAVGDKGSLFKALSKGADDFLTKPAMEEELQLRVKNGIRLLRQQSQEELIFALAKLSEYRSDETGFHLERVQLYTRLLAMYFTENCPELKITHTMADEIAKVSPLHDIGKVAIPDNILHKPDKLTAAEFEIIMTHAMVGGSLLKETYVKTRSPYLKIACEMATYHHERYNGKGYPAQLAGENIPLSARIMALADVYDALTSKRCYKESFPHEMAKEIIVRERGEQFDPKVVDAFLCQEDSWLAVRHKYKN